MAESNNVGRVKTRDRATTIYVWGGLLEKFHEKRNPQDFGQTVHGTTALEWTFPESEPRD